MEVVVGGEAVDLLDEEEGFNPLRLPHIRKALEATLLGGEKADLGGQPAAASHPGRWPPGAAALAGSPSSDAA